jgi:hypothetical protein
LERKTAGHAGGVIGSAGETGERNDETIPQSRE